MYLLSLILVTLFHQSALSAPLTFDFKDSKGVNQAAFTLDAPLEAISGTAHGVSGTLSFDPDRPSTTTGKLVITTASLHVTNPMMKEHMHGPQWMDVAKYPEITFEVKELKNVKTEGTKTAADVTGVITIKGVSKMITVSANATYLKDKLGQRIPNQKGDLLVIRTSFVIKRDEFNINPKAPTDKVANDIQLTLSIAGAAPR